MTRRSCITTYFLAGMLLLPLTSQGCVHRPSDDIRVEIIGSGGRAFHSFRVPSEDGQRVFRAYLEARNQERYQVRITNRTAHRVAVVIAVDGRNIISGARSELASNEPKYILDALESQTYEGWRTSSEQVHAFYFTDWQDSYAEAFGDRSARGVIAVAAYSERLDREADAKPYDAPAPQASRSESASGEAPATLAGAGLGKDAEAARARQDSEPGTGFGEEIKSASVLVAFEAEPEPSARYFFKYEWRDTLCRKGFVTCAQPDNRFWNEGRGFAPFPPGK